MNHTLLLTINLLFSGCNGNTKLTIVDDAGLPIAGAIIVSQSLTMDGNCSISKTDGSVYVPSNFIAQEIRFMKISATGYDDLLVDLSALTSHIVTMNKIRPTRR